MLITIIRRALARAPHSEQGTRYPRNWRSLRRSILERDGYRCRNCGRRRGELHVHHVVPLSNGGANVPGNLIVLCRGCHERVEAHVARLPRPRRRSRFSRIPRRRG